MAEASLVITPRTNTIYTTLANKNSGVTIYQPHDVLPESPPDKYLVIRALTASIDEDWGVRRTGIQNYQILCAATDSGSVRTMANSILSLNESAFGVTGTGMEFWNGAHYELPVSVEFEL